MLRLYPDGTLLFRMRADDEFLAWGQARRGFLQSPTLNPIAVVESHASFMHLYKRVLGMLARMPDKVRVQLAFINAMVGQRPLSLTKYYQRGITWVVDPVLYPIHTPNAVAELDIPAEFLVANPDAAALEVLRSFYDLFDAEPALIPFTRQVEGVEQVDVEQIVRLSG